MYGRQDAKTFILEYFIRQLALEFCIGPDLFWAQERSVLMSDASTNDPNGKLQADDVMDILRLIG
jgi:hypothetical protein